MALVDLLNSEVWADSGSASDIQNAVDEATITGITTVWIPEGTFNFVEVGQQWRKVTIPEGIRLKGAPTERDVAGQVIEWKTIINMPFEASDQSVFFEFIGNRNPNKLTQFCNVKLVGYREINNNSTTRYMGVTLSNIAVFRIDHNYFRNVCGYATALWGTDCTGVIDHNKFVNSHGSVPTDGDFNGSTVWYGVNVGIDSQWETNIQNVLGKNGPNTVFIEDNYFERWRHCVASNNGAHYVFRHNKIQYSLGYGEIDAHGGTAGTRAIEVYDNELLDPAWYDYGIYWRGGGGVCFGNTVRGYGNPQGPAAFIYLSQETPDSVPERQVKAIWIWNNTLLPSNSRLVTVYYGSSNPIREGIEYFFNAPTSFNYVPYTYPHPLTVEGPPIPPETTPWQTDLEEGTYIVTMPSPITVNDQTYNFKSWEDGSTTPARTINLTAYTAITATYELQAPPPPPPPGKGYLDIHAFLNSQEIVVPFEITEMAVAGDTPKIVEVDPGTYTIKATLGAETKTETAQVLEGQTVRVDLKFEALPTPPIAIVPVVSATAGLILTGIAIS